MGYRYKKIEVRTYGRREFVQLLGASVATAALTGGCSEAPLPIVGPNEISPITPNEEFYEVSYLGMVDVDPAEWKCVIQRNGTEVGSLNVDFIHSLSAREREHTFQCIESKPIDQRMSNAIWGGLPFVEVLDHAGIEIDKTATHIRFQGADGYSVGNEIDVLDAPAWMVWRMNGEILPRAHGFPARMLIPNLYGWKCCKQVVEIDFLDEPYVAPWEKWYHSETTAPDYTVYYQIQNLVVHPADMALIDDGQRIRILGKAYAGSDPIEWIGISTDGGDTYKNAEITYGPGPDRWTLWRHIWTPPGPGTYELACKARSESGRETGPDFFLFPPYQGGMTLEVKIS